MRIKKIKSQQRRDFYAIYECEHCGHTQRGSGYDDDNFHQNIIPKMKCKKCGEPHYSLTIEGDKAIEELGHQS